MLKKFFPRILKSRKGQAMIAGLLVTVMGEHMGLTLDEAEVQSVVALLVAYIVGQGVADHGAGGSSPTSGDG
ncbi:MAG: hypothetical protein ACE5NA_00160 [Nitrospiraceae bacterium]